MLGPGGDVRTVSLWQDENLSSTEVVFNDGLGNTLSQKTRKIRMNMRGRLVVDNTIVRQIEDVISVRNDLLL